MAWTILDEIVAHKRVELERDRARISFDELRSRARDLPSTRPFADALRRDGAIRLIAEVKKASPSRGVIRPDFSPVAIAQEYEAHGADALSVLTDERFFQGRLDFVPAIRAAVGLPILRKDFTIDPYHIWQARVAGADAVLLIVSVLSDSMLSEFLGCAMDVGLAALVEVHDAEELERAIAAGAEIIGINNRDLRTFKTSLDTTFAIRPKIPSHCLVVSESGIDCRDDVRRLEAACVDAILVGESLMRSKSIGAKIAELRSEAGR